MRKLLILLLMAAATVFTLSACGGGSGSDPLGTDSITLSPATSQVDPGGTVELTATVTNASGDPVANRTVYFSIATDASGGAQLTDYEPKTDGEGKAPIQYIAGPNNGVDKVHAYINNGKSSDVFITVGSGGMFTEYQVNLAQGDKLVSAGGIYSILIATVKGMDTLGNLTGVPNEPVTFSILTGTTTGTLKDIADNTNIGPPVTVNTNAEGVAKVIFEDTNTSGTVIFDARISTGIDDQLTISWP